MENISVYMVFSYSLMLSLTVLWRGHRDVVVLHGTGSSGGSAGRSQGSDLR